jgi:two-component system, OmpR family, sensor kinase
VLTPAARRTAYGPAIPAGAAWLAAHLARPLTVPGAGTSGRWRVVIEAVRYQPQRILYVYGLDDVRYLVGRRPGPGSGGALVVMTGLAGTSRLAARYAAAAGAVLVLLAGAAFALTRTILRPLREAAELAESAGPAAGGELCASRAAEAAARRSADEMSRHLGRTALDLLSSVNVVRGFAEYYRQQPEPPVGRLDRMLRRVAGEAARMETLIAGLEEAAPGSAGPVNRRHRGGPRAR